MNKCRKEQPTEWQLDHKVSPIVESHNNDNCFSGQGALQSFDSEQRKKLPFVA